MWKAAESSYLRAMGRAVLVLLFLMEEGRPVAAREAARQLGVDYETMRKYLYDLEGMLAVRHRPAGWAPTEYAYERVMAAVGDWGWGDWGIGGLVNW